ncbi:MAG: hypothetical protein UD936_01970 [Acutalibacteraceae bacterium]|nr:hypothetical protein [Acutalibacteraceae bacterium]
MKILVACEESQRVCMELRKLGHEAYSCDIQECSGGHPEWHVLGDCLPLLNGCCSFNTQDGKSHCIKGKWDMIIAHPPCTRLCASGQRWLYYGSTEYQHKKKEEQLQAIDFFMKFVNADCDKIAIENPVGIMNRLYRKPNQIIQPFEFGDPYSKKTCLWLKGLPNLKPTKVLEKPEKGWINQHICKDGRNGGFVNYDENGKVLSWNDPRTTIIRSKTYPGIAKAIAEQWAGMAKEKATSDGNR